MNGENQISCREGFLEDWHAVRHVRRVDRSARDKQTLSVWRKLCNLAEQLRAPHSGHLDIGYDKMNAALLDDFENLKWPIRCQYFMPSCSSIRLIRSRNIKSSSTTRTLAADTASSI